MSQQRFLHPWIQQALIRLVAERTGLRIREHDQSLFVESILSRIQELGFSCPERYYGLLLSESTDSQWEWERLASRITNSESFFFRDKGQFKLLRETIIPNVLNHKRQDRTLRICSAGCSTGEEPYSIAMLLTELIPDLTQWTITILGVDLNPVAIQQARMGVYRPWSFRGVDMNIRRQFFREDNGTYHLSEHIKAMVTFQVANLLKDSFSALDYPLESMDLILCRNVFIYFDDVAIAHVLTKLNHALNKSGYLMVGHAELHKQNASQFQITAFEESIVYQRTTGWTTPPRSPLIPPSHARPSGLDVMTPCPQEMTAHRLEALLEQSDIQLQKTALNLLRQLPAGTRIPRLGNLTAAELMHRLQQNLNLINENP